MTDADVVELAPFRERRAVRRAAAVGLVVAVVLGSAWRLQELFETIEAAIRAAAELLPADEDVDEASA